MTLLIVPLMYPDLLYADASRSELWLHGFATLVLSPSLRYSGESEPAGLAGFALNCIHKHYILTNHERVTHQFKL
jgi:hypothetical protein